MNVSANVSIILDHIKNGINTINKLDKIMNNLSKTDIFEYVNQLDKDGVVNITYQTSL